MKRGTDWFRRNAIMRLPLGHPGFGRDVYPGFLQLSGFMSLNLDRHATAHWDLYKHLVQGDVAEERRPVCGHAAQAGQPPAAMK